MIEIWAYFDLALLGYISPALGLNTRSPLKINAQRRLGLMIDGGEASHVIPCFRCRERELTRIHLIRVMVRGPGAGRYLYKIAAKSDLSRQKHSEARSNWTDPRTLTEILWDGGKAWPSWGLSTLYLPTVMELLLMSSAIHFVRPECKSKCSDCEIREQIPRIRSTVHKFCDRRNIFEKPREIRKSSSFVGFFYFPFCFLLNRS